MYLHKIRLLNFKNYTDTQLSFSAGINCFTGVNGSGKTNLLDAVFYLCMTRSAFHLVEQHNVKHGEAFFTLRGEFEKEGKVSQVGSTLQQGQKKVFSLNKKPYTRNSDHLGRFPCVLIEPNDTDLVREGSETRRKFFDSILCQTDRTYLDGLIRYNAVLKQRNNLLKLFAERNIFDPVLLQTYDEQLLPLNQVLCKIRQEFIRAFVPIFKEKYNFIAESKENVGLTYGSDALEEGFAQAFKEGQAKDRLLQRTCMGIHRDDFSFLIGEYPVKRFGSQGQQKSFIIALKIAQFEIMAQRAGCKPILLMDDIFDKLDDSRISKLLELIGQAYFGQVFLTDARPERSKRLMARVNKPVAFFDIEALGQSS